MIKIDLAWAAQELADLQRVSTRLSEAWRDADDSVTRLHSAWEGESAAAHYVANDLWRKDVDAMMTALADMAKALATAHENYTSSSTANTKMWQS